MRRLVLTFVLIVLLTIGSLEVMGYTSGDVSECYDWSINAVIGDIELTDDITCGTTGGFNFLVSDAIFDCNNYSIGGTGDSIGIYANGKSNIIIKDCEIYNFDEGIKISSSTDITIENSKLHGNSEGIYLDTSENVVIENSELYENVYYGTFLYFSNNNHYSNNKLYENGRDGVYFSSSDNNIFQSNEFYDNLEDGVGVHFSEDNEILENTMWNNGETGIYLNNAENTVIESNNVSENYHGLYSKESNSTLIQENTFYLNQVGVFLNNSDDNEVKSNNISDNLGHGLRTSDYSGDVIISDNYLEGNGAYGFWLGQGSDNYEITNNQLMNNYGNLYLYGYNNNIVGNRFCFAQQYVDASCLVGSDNVGSDNFFDSTLITCGFSTSNHTCYEQNACDDGLDNDADGLIDCADPDCENLLCGENNICQGGACVVFDLQAPTAPTPEYEMPLYIETYTDFFAYLNSGYVYTNTANTCNDHCSSLGLTCLFADAGMKTCSSTGSTKCTCYVTS